MMTRLAAPAFFLLLVSLVSSPAAGQVTFERLIRANDEPHNWLTYSGTYSVSVTACSSRST